MRTVCPQCRGERRYYRPKSKPLGAVSNIADMSAVAETTYERELVDCERCNGDGEVVRTEPIPVMQDGRKIGTVPASFDPSKIKSTSFWYEPRAGDFRQVGETWVASRTLGPGDLEAVPGFVWHRE